MERVLFNTHLTKKGEDILSNRITIVRPNPPITSMRMLTMSSIDEPKVSSPSVDTKRSCIGNPTVYCKKSITQWRESKERNA